MDTDSGLGTSRVSVEIVPRGKDQIFTQQQIASINRWIGETVIRDESGVFDECDLRINIEGARQK